VLSGTVDEYGNDIYIDKNVSVSNCVFQPGGSSESLAFADQVDTTDTIFMPYGTDVAPLDAIVYDGETFEVTGIPSEWVSPFSGRVSPIRINVRKVSGVSALWLKLTFTTNLITRASASC